MSYLTDDEMDVLDKLYDGATKDAATLAAPDGEAFAKLLMRAYINQTSRDPLAPERYYITEAGKRALDRAIASKLNPRPKLAMLKPRVATIDTSIAAPPRRKR